jgi:hypothetical protein
MFESYWLQSFVSIPLQASAGMLNCAVVPATFSYRYYLTKRQDFVCLKILTVLFRQRAPSTFKTFGFFAVSLFFAVVDGLVAGPSYYYSAKCRPDFDYGSLWFIEAPVPQLIVGALVNTSYKTILNLPFSVTN